MSTIYKQYLTHQNPMEILGNVTKFADRLLKRFRVMNARSQHPSHPPPPQGTRIN